MATLESNPDVPGFKTAPPKRPLQPKRLLTPPQKQQPSRSSSFFQNLVRGWNNLSLQVKLMLLLMAATAVPVIVVTQQLTKLSEDRSLSDLKASLREKATILLEEYVLRTNETAKANAETIAQSVQEAGIDLSQPQKLATQRDQLQKILPLRSNAAPEEIMSFKILTDAQGRTIAQNIQVLSDNFSNYPPLPALDGSLIAQQYSPVSLPPGIALGDVPIVKDALQTGRALAGMELLKAEPLQRLGLGQQAAIGVRSQVVKGLPESKQPFPEGTYDVDGGKAGLVSMAVYPIKVKGRLVGTAIVGSLLNRNYRLIDKFHQKYPNVTVVTVFAQDWRVTTNVPYVDPKTNASDNTRAIGTRSSRQVAEAVLNQGKEFVGSANIVGVNYLTTYIPLYDHQKELNPQARSVGMVFVGKPLTDINNALQSQRLLGYGIGGGILLLAGLVAIPVAGTFSRPLRRLADSAQRIEAGEQGVKIEVIERQDEIGQLYTSLFNLLEPLAINEEQLRREANERLKQASLVQQESEVLQADVSHILDIVSAVEEGDLTVQAQVSDRATGLVADTLNRLVEELGQTMAQVLKVTQQVSQGSITLEQLAQTVANNAQQQAQEVVQVLNLTEQVQESAQSSALQVNLANQSLLNMRTCVEQGQSEINTMTQGIDVLQQGTDRIVQQMQALGEFVGLADQFVQEHNEIVSVTQMLAMSATIVSARAAEQQDPRQFLGLAREFGTIAEQVKALAKQTNHGLGSLQKRTAQVRSVVSAINGDVKNLAGLVSGFTTGVEQSNQVFGNVRTATEQVVQAGEAVAQSSQEIVNATQSTAKAMHDIADLAERTAQLTENTRSQSEQMETLSRQLLSSIQLFRLPVALSEQSTVNSYQLSVNSEQLSLTTDN